MQILFECVGGFFFFSPYLEKSLTENPTDMFHGRKKTADNCFLSLYCCPYSVLPDPLPRFATFTS